MLFSAALLPGSCAALKFKEVPLGFRALPTVGAHSGAIFGAQLHCEEWRRDFTEIAQLFRCFRELGEEPHPLFVQEADEPRDYGEAAELEQIRSAGPVLPVTN